MTIDERIAWRMEKLSKCLMQKQSLEAGLKRINEKIDVHIEAINNLKDKDERIEYDKMKNPKQRT